MHDKNGKTPFDLAVINGYKEIAKMKPAPGSTLLHIFAKHGKNEKLKSLLQQTPELALMQDDDGRTPLHLAAESGQQESVQLLMEHAPEAAQAKTLSSWFWSQSYTAEDVAIKNGHQRIASLIQATTKGVSNLVVVQFFIKRRRKCWR